MDATVIVGMLCVHLLCFCVMFGLISQRLPGRRMGMDVFALGNLLLGSAYVLQLVEGPAGWSAMSVVNHTFTLAAPVAYCLGAARFFGVAVPVLRPLIVFALGYSAAQVMVYSGWGVVARHAVLSGSAAVLFAAMAGAAIYGMRTFAKDLRWEMLWFAVLIGGICVLNALKLGMLLKGGLATLDMSKQFQLTFYIYMSFLATVLPPSMVWLVLRRLTEALRATAVRDPLTQLLNRRGLDEGLTAYFSSRKASPAYVIAADVDYFKRVNDRYGHQTGDVVLRGVADVLRDTVRRGDLVCRMGGEEFVTICLDTDAQGALLLAERIRAAVELHHLQVDGNAGAVECTVTLGVSHCFGGMQTLEQALQQADEALYRGKAGGRNRVEWAGNVMQPQATPRLAPVGMQHQDAVLEETL